MSLVGWGRHRHEPDQPNIDDVTALPLAQCQTHHAGVRRTITVSMGSAKIQLVECAICDRRRCPHCRVMVAHGREQRCAVCGTSLSLA